MSTLSLLFAVWVVSPPAAAHELSLQPLAASVETSLGQVEQLTHHGALGAGLVGTEDAHRSYERALSDLFLGDTAAAAERLFALRRILADPALVADVEWHLVQALDAEGLGQLRDEVLADIIASDGHPHRREAASRQIRLAAAAGRVDRLAELQAELAAQGLPVHQPELRYALARAWVALGQPERGRDALTDLATSSTAFAGRASYLVGVTAVQQADLDDATAWFERALDVATDPAVRDHATLALARIAYESGDLEGAIDRYQSVSGMSPVLDQALYELAWSYVRADRSDAAIRTIELYLLAFGDRAEAGRLSVVRGHLLMGAERYDEAEVVYADLGAELSPVDDHLRQLTPAALAQQLRSTDATSDSLPLWVKTELRGQPLTMNALTLDGAARAVATDIAEAELVADEVAALADQPVVLRRHRRVRSRVFRALASIGHTLISAARVELDGRRGRAQRQLAQPLRSEIEAVHTSMVDLEEQAAFQAGMEEVEGELQALVDRAEAALAQLRSQRTDDHHDVSYERLDGWVEQLVSARRTASELLDELDENARSLRQPLLDEVGRHRQRLTTSRKRQRRVAEQAAAVWASSAAARIRLLQSRVDHSLRECMAGVADASWAQVQTTLATREQLIEERDARVERLEAMFDIMRARQ